MANCLKIRRYGGLGIFLRVIVDIWEELELGVQPEMCVTVESWAITLPSVVTQNGLA